MAYKYPTYCCGLLLEEETELDTPVLKGCNPILRIEIRSYLGSRHEGKYCIEVLKWEGFYSFCGENFQRVYGPGSADRAPEELVVLIEAEVVPRLLAINNLLNWAKSYSPL